MNELVKPLKQMVFWSLLEGYSLIIAGAMMIIANVTNFAGLVGVVPLLLGIVLVKVGRRAKEALVSKSEQDIARLLQVLVTFLRWQIIIVILVIVAAVILMAIAFIAALFGEGVHGAIDFMNITA